MKNSPTPVEDTAAGPEPTPAWREALDLLDADLRRRGAAVKTRRAYAIDVGQFALWCGAQDLDPAEVTPRTLRRYAATLSHRRAVAATVARKLAALRALYRALREHGAVAQNPADLIPSPKRPRNLPRVLRPDEMAALLDRIPASTPLELRDRALFEVAYASGLRAEELVTLDVAGAGFCGGGAGRRGKGGGGRRLRRRGAARGGQGRQGADRARGRAGAAGGRALPRTRPPGAREPRRRGGALSLAVRAAPVDVRRAPPAAGLDPPRRGAGRRLA